MDLRNLCDILGGALTLVLKCVFVGVSKMHTLKILITLVMVFAMVNGYGRRIKKYEGSLNEFHLSG